MMTFTWRLPLIAARLFIALNADGGNRPHLTEYDERSNQRLVDAPLVVVGVAGADVRVGRPVPSRKDPNCPMQLHRVSVRIENVLRGVMNKRDVFVHYYAFGGPFNGPRPLGFSREPTRRILGLRWDSGVLRTACDGWDICTWYVESGAHLDYKPDPRKPLGFALCDILFTRGTGRIDEYGFAREVAWGAPVPEDYLFQKLVILARTEGPVLKNAACSLLRIYTATGEISRTATDALGLAGCPR